MRIKLFSRGKFYRIACPPGTRVLRCWGQPTPVDPGGHDLLMAPYEGRGILVPTDPPELLPLLAEAGLCGLSLIGGRESAMMLAGVASRNCGEDDPDWLAVEDDSETARCDRCGRDFVLADRSDPRLPNRLSADRPR